MRMDWVNQIRRLFRRSNEPSSRDRLPLEFGEPLPRSGNDQNKSLAEVLGFSSWPNPSSSRADADTFYSTTPSLLELPPPAALPCASYPRTGTCDVSLDPRPRRCNFPPLPH